MNAFTYSLRATAATVATASGVLQVGALWYRELNDAALADALLGSVYLILAIGLAGQSRFVLFLGMAIPALVTVAPLASPEPLHALRGAGNLAIALCSALALWRQRHGEKNRAR